jgi:hypothetical protein
MSGRMLLLLLPSLLLVQGDGESRSPAGTPAIVFDSIGGSGGGLVVNATDGWEFSVEKPVTITSLGVWDHNLDGFATEIPVGLWNSEGKLLATQTVPEGKAATEVDGFRYVDIVPIVLQPGSGYVIGAAYTPRTKENIAGGNSNGKFFSDGAIRWVKRRRVIKKEGLAFPEPQSGSGSIEAMPGGFGPNFTIAEPTNPRIYYRTHKVDDDRSYVMVKLAENQNASHSRDLVIFVSLFARKNGELTQILMNGEPLGTGPEALETVASTARKLTDGVTKIAGVRPDIRIAAPSWVRYSDLAKVVDACSGRVTSTVRRTTAMRVELSTYRDNGLPLSNGDVTGRFIEKGDCVEDTWTGLLWQKDGAASGRKNYQQAADYAASLKLNGLSGWRVPTIEEMASVFPADDTPFVNSGYTLEQCCAPPHEYNSYWTSELDDRQKDYAYVYHWYDKGGANNGYASRNFVRVRCVRDVEGTVEDAKPGDRREPSREPSKVVPGIHVGGIRRAEPLNNRATAQPTVRIRDPKARQVVDFVRTKMIGRTITGRVATGFDNGRLETVFERRTTFERLLESQNGFGFDEVIEIRETIRPRSKSGAKPAPARQDNRRVILRHQYSVRRSNGGVVGYAREVSDNEGQLSTAAVVKRAVVDFSNGELIIRTSTVGYDDHVTAKGFGPGAVKEQSKYSVHGGLLQRSQANEFFSVAPDDFAQKPSRRETELIVATEEK